MENKYFAAFVLFLFIVLSNFYVLVLNHRGGNYEVSENLLDYFNNKNELRFNYTQVEVIHLSDVKLLMNLLKYLNYITGIAIFILLWINKDDFSRIFVLSGLFSISFVLILLLFNFSFLFTGFHKILFTNDYWLLPSDSLLIKTYPLAFFFGFFKRLVLNIIITSLIVIGAGLLKNVHSQHKPRPP